MQANKNIFLTQNVEKVSFAVKPLVFSSEKYKVQSGAVG